MKFLREEECSGYGGRIPLNPSISQFLEGLQQQGAHESSGRFTLDPRRARELLRNCQLAEQHHYILCLISFMVGMGARGLRLECSPDRVELIGEGLVIPREILANPLEGLFSARPNPALRELAIGINSALGYAQATLQLRSSDGYQGLYTNQAFDCQPWPGEDKQETCCTLQRRADPQKEIEAVSRFFNFCPLPLTVQGKALSAALEPPQNCLAIELFPTQAGAGQRLRLDGSPALVRRRCPAPLHACIWVGEAVEPVCRWIFLGRTYEKPLPWSVLQGELPIQMWVACDQLDKDLSMAQLLDNDRYTRVTHFLRSAFLQEVDGLLEQVLQPGAFTAPDMARLRPLVVFGLEACARAAALPQALELQRALLNYPATAQQTRLDQYRLSLLRDPTDSQPEPADSLEELWEASRASLAIRGARSHKTAQLLFQCGEAAYQAGRHELVVACLGPYLTIHAARAEATRALYGHSLLMLGRFHEARLHLNRSLSAWRTDSDMPEWALQALEHLATSQAQLGETREAAKTLADVLRRRQALAGSRSRSLGLILLRLAALCRKLDDSKTANHYENWAQQLDQ
jgi:hypothetical protein